MANAINSTGIETSGIIAEPILIQELGTETVASVPAVPEIEVWSAHTLNGDRLSSFGRIHCHLCSKTVTGQGAFDDHRNGKVHKRNMLNQQTAARSSSIR